MKFTVKGLQTLKGMGYINLVVPVPLSEEEEINKIDPEKQYVVEVKQWRKGRSNDANKYAWVIVSKDSRKAVRRELSQQGRCLQEGNQGMWLRQNMASAN